MRLAVLMMVAAVPLYGQGAPPSGGPWVLAGDSTRLVQFEGREAIRMYTGSATRTDLVLQDGTIDVDVRTTRRRSFVYLRFRVEDEDNAEEFYLRPHKSELPDAAQYAPVFNGQSAWQLYHGERGTAAPAIETGVWTRLRVVLSGTRAAVFLGDTVKPLLVVPLARTPRAGYVQLASFLPAGTPGSGPIAWFSNLQVRPNVIAYAFPPERVVPLPSGVIARWSLGPSFVTKDVEPRAIAPAWMSPARVATVEPNGMVELNRWLPNPAGYDPAARQDMGVVARVTVTAARAGPRALQLGFSDAATVFLNGTPLFHGDDSYVFAQRRDGIIGFDQATIYLPLKAGANELAIVVTDHFGGWGVMGRFTDMRGLAFPP